MKKGNVSIKIKLLAHSLVPPSDRGSCCLCVVSNDDPTGNGG